MDTSKPPKKIWGTIIDIAISGKEVRSLLHPRPESYLKQHEFEIALEDYEAYRKFYDELAGGSLLDEADRVAEQTDIRLFCDPYMPD